MGQVNFEKEQNWKVRVPDTKTREQAVVTKADQCNQTGSPGTDAAFTVP